MPGSLRGQHVCGAVGVATLKLTAAVNCCTSRAAQPKVSRSLQPSTARLHVLWAPPISQTHFPSALSTKWPRASLQRSPWHIKQPAYVSLRTLTQRPGTTPQPTLRLSTLQRRRGLNTPFPAGLRQLHGSCGRPRTQPPSRSSRPGQPGRSFHGSNGGPVGTAHLPWRRHLLAVPSPVCHWVTLTSTLTLTVALDCGSPTVPAVTSSARLPETLVPGNMNIVGPLKVLRCGPYLIHHGLHQDQYLKVFVIKPEKPWKNKDNVYRDV